MKRNQSSSLLALLVSGIVIMGSCQNPIAPPLATVQDSETERGITSLWTSAYFRGTPNNWGATAMTLVANNTWETTQDFTGQTNPRFKISRYNSNWNEAYPAQDYLITSPGKYKIQFNDSTKAITISLVTTGWAEAYFRGTPNNWGVTAMTKTANNTWETIQNFTGQTNPRFKIDRYGNWNESYPTKDYLISSPGQYKITFSDSTKAITVTKLSTTEWSNAYFRGTPNNWGTTAMSKVGTNLWQTVQDFSGQTNPRFKIDRNGDWTENYPAQDYLISTPGRYKITFNDSTKSITVDIDTPNQVAAPAFTPPAGSVYTSTPITLACSTPGASIYYTTNGSTPTTSSTKYTAPFTLNAGMITVKAIGVLQGAQNSPVASATYTVTVPAGGITVYVKNYTHIYYWNAQPSGSVTTVSWPGVTLNSDPTGWKQYTLPGVTSVNLIFSNNGSGQTGDLSRSSGTWWYKNNTWYNADPDGPEVPVITASPNPGKYTTAQNVVLKSSNPDDVIYYTRDGTTPTQTSPRYSTPISVTSLDTIKAFGVNRNGVVGSIVTLTYDVNSNHDLTPPTITPQTSPGVYPSAITVRFTVSDNKPGVQAWYTTQNRTATTSDTAYTSGSGISVNSTQTFNFLVRDAAGNQVVSSFTYLIGAQPRGDFREETIYFVMTTRFYDGDPSNNVYCWDDTQAGNVTNNDPAWRGDFKGLIEKLDYIKALGFSAIRITPVVKNMSGYDYHGYHAVNHSIVDPRYESAGYNYQRLINEAHARGIKIIQDVVVNHTGNFGEENLHPLFNKDANGDYINWQNPNQLVANTLLEQAAQQFGGSYSSLTPGNQFQARIKTLRAPLDVDVHYHNHNFQGGWEQYEVQLGSIAGDCQDLNTENPSVAEYIRNAYVHFINMGVDAFRIDTVKHVSRLTFNREFIPQWKQAGGENFFIFGEVATRYRSIWNDNKPAISTPFYTWKWTNGKWDSQYAWGSRTTNENSAYQHWLDNQSVGNQPSSDNHLLLNNTYRTPDWSKRSGLDVIDFPMHWAFNNVWDAWNTAVGGDWAYSDATFNVTYVDSHDYAPDTAPENKRYTGSWPEKLSLMFTFRGIPTIYYGTEIEFKKGAVIDVGPNAPLEQTGRAYFGNHITGSLSVQSFGRYSNVSGNMAQTLSHPLAQHVRALNLIRRAVPALQKGQYSVNDVSGAMAFRRRYSGPMYNGQTVDSFALVALDGVATFYNVPNGTYRDVVTGQSINVTNGTATLGAGGAGNLRVWVLYGGPNQQDPGHVLAGMFPMTYIK